ncbi:GCN5-like 1 domain-containing protein [Mucor ambiguus]|uniref:Biogenesis of lysosome-related organelles complex 1 subunit 1 n=1 Tax=Mucor ambiguus TaxID=91626 RepID=A0A0C9ME13_9FUNG|nr:GCN5-like 1 domain-containing protein [Mucor ambiguus]
MSESLSQLLKSHNQKQNEARKQNEQLKNNAIQSTNELTDSITEYVNDGVTEIFSRQKELEQQSRKLANQTTKYANQTQQWLTLVDDFNMSLKVITGSTHTQGTTDHGVIQELGDVRNWAEIMEHDMKTIMSTLEFVHQGTIGGAEPIE